MATGDCFFCGQWVGHHKMPGVAAIKPQRPHHLFWMDWPPNKYWKDESHDVFTREDTICPDRWGVCMPMDEIGTSMMKCWCIDCKVWGASLTTESLQSHLETQHDIFRLFILNWDIVIVKAPEVYHATNLLTTGLYFWLVAQCGGQPGTRFNLCHHFRMWHPQDLICILIEGSQPLLKC